jgi:EcsC protein family
VPNELIPEADVVFLREAATYLESPSYLMKIADTIGVPLQAVADRIVPARIAELGNQALQKAMTLATDTVIASLGGGGDFEKAYVSSGWTGLWHRVAATVSGGVGGAFGFPGLVVELPVTTGILFRSIASIANDFGEDIRAPESRLECLAVFSHGGPSETDNAMEASYITARIAMTQLIREAAQFMASNTSKSVAEAVTRGTAPALLALLNRIAAQFNIAVSQKFIAQSIPVIGIATGAALNNAFAGHFNSVARYHFGMRKLERRHGQDAVYDEYRRQLADVRRKLAAGPK